MSVAVAPHGLAVAATTIRDLGRLDYRDTYSRMRGFTATRTERTPDELWIVEHPPVYTVGLAGRDEHLPRHGNIAVERIDRGGQITYHGPGQAIVYTLVDLGRRHLKVRTMVSLLEHAAIDLLASARVTAQRRPDAPGVYVNNAKIAALGLRVTRGCCYHGIALNVDMDLTPFAAIDPCGYPGLAVTQTKALGVARNRAELGRALAERILHLLDHTP